MADMVKLSHSVTERQLNAIRAEARRRDVAEGEVVRGILDFWIDLTCGRTSVCASVFAAPINGKTAA